MHLIRKGQIGHIPSRTTSHIEHPRLKGKRLLKVRGQAADCGLVTDAQLRLRFENSSQRSARP